MPLGTSTISHLDSFDVFTSPDGVAQATREMLKEWTLTDKPRAIEAFTFRNSYIVSDDFTGGMFANMSMSRVSLNNPAGSYRGTVLPRNFSTTDAQSFDSLADVKFAKNIVDQFTLNIDRYKQTENRLIDPTSQGDSWLAKDVVSSITQILNNDITREINYFVYSLIQEGALYSVTAWEGKSPYVAVAQSNSETFANELIDDIATYEARPNDKYLEGFDLDEILIIMKPSSRATMLKAKLQVFDGSFLSMDGKWYTGLPYDGMYSGALYKTSKYLVPRGTKLSNQMAYFITPIGRFAPLLFHLAGIQLYSEVMPGTRQSISVYGSSLYGTKVEPLFSQYLTVKTEGNVTKPYADYNWKEVTAEDVTSTGFKISGSAYGSTTDAARTILYRVVKANVPSPSGNWTPIQVGGADLVLEAGTDASGPFGEFTSDEITTDVNGDSLETRTRYRVEIAMSSTAAASGNGILTATAINPIDSTVSTEYSFKDTLSIWTK